MPDPRWFECPVIIPYMGGKFELGKKLLDNSGLEIIAADDLADAAAKVVKAIK